MRSSRFKRALTWGDVPRGGTRWQDLPEYVQDRVKNRPWDDTPEDQFLQRLDPGLFICRNPINHQREIWISAPEPQLANGISLICVLEYPPDPKAGYPGEEYPDVDERVLIMLGRLRPDMQFNYHEFMKMKEKMMERLERDKRMALEESNKRLAENVAASMTDHRKDGKIMRPVPSVVVQGLR